MSYQTSKLHTIVSPGDLKIIATIIGRLENSVARQAEGDNYKPEPRPQLVSGNAVSKIRVLRDIIDKLTYIADTIEDDEMARKEAA